LAVPVADALPEAAFVSDGLMIVSAPAALKSGISELVGLCKTSQQHLCAMLHTLFTGLRGDHVTKWSAKVQGLLI
jgi:hypothetical protein